MSKFKKGDKVRVVSEIPEDEECICFVKDMEEYLGKVLTIKKYNAEREYYRTEENQWCWSEEWLTLVEEEIVPEFKKLEGNMIDTDRIEKKYREDFENENQKLLERIKSSKFFSDSMTDLKKAYDALVQVKAKIRNLEQIYVDILLIILILILAGCNQWIDNDKTGDNDGDMCWAASAANIIESKTGQENVFEFFKNNFENKPWHPAKALRKLGYDPLSKRFEIGSFRRDLKNYGVLLITFGGETQVYHAITVWCMLGDTLLVTDSDDNFHGIVAHQIIDNKLDGIYKIYGYYGI